MENEIDFKKIEKETEKLEKEWTKYENENPSDVILPKETNK